MSKTDAGEANSSASKTTPPKTKEATKQGPEIVYEKGPEPQPGTVLAKAGDIEVTLADFQRSMQRSMLIAPKGMTEVPKERLATPHLHINVVRNLLGTKIVRQEAKRRGLEASLDEKVAALESQGRLAEYAPLLAEQKKDAPALEKRGLTLEDIDTIARDIVLRQKLRDALIQEVSDEQLWRAYEQKNDRIRLLVVGARNTPTSDEIGQFIDENPDEIREHFEANKKRYRQPEMVRLAMLSPEPGTKVDPSVLEKAAERLETDPPIAVADDLGLELDKDALLVRGENPKAFDAKEGSTGFQTSGARGAYAWRVEGHRESEEAELTASLKREIASELLRNNQMVASKRVRIAEAIELMEKLPKKKNGSVPPKALDDLVDKLEEKRLEVHVTDMFSRNQRGFIPGVGLAEELAKTAFSLSMKDPVADEPILSRRKVWAVRVLDREKKDREDFEKEKAAFRKEFTQRMGKRVVTQFVSQYEDKHDATLDLAPLRVKYGTLQKN